MNSTLIDFNNFMDGPSAFPQPDQDLKLLLDQLSLVLPKQPPPRIAAKAAIRDMVKPNL
jgi:hypothetical protein